MAADKGAPAFEISSVISRALEAVGANLGLFAGLSLMLAGIPAFAFSLGRTLALSAVDTGYDFKLSHLLLLGLGWLVSMVANTVLQAALTRATVLHLSGERPDFDECLRIGLSMILPLIAIGFLMGIGIALGALLLLIPGIILWVMWSVVIPVYVQERAGIGASFTRSAQLTQGARWKICLMMLVLLVGILLLSVPAGIVTGIAASIGGDIGSALASAAFSALSGMVMVSVHASIYVELRQAKEGIAPSDLESIFA